MMDVIGTQHPLHPLIKSPIGEANQVKMVNLYNSRPHRLIIHCPTCSLSPTFRNLLELVTVFDANQRSTVRQLHQHPGLPATCVYVYRLMISPLIFNLIKGEYEKLKMNTKAQDHKIANLETALSTLSEQQRIDAQRFALAGDVQSELLGKGTAPRPSSVLVRRQAMNEIETWNTFNLEVAQYLANRVHENDVN